VMLKSAIAGAALSAVTVKLRLLFWLNASPMASGISAVAFGCVHEALSRRP
jgi:hypothetical protein